MCSSMHAFYDCNHKNYKLLILISISSLLVYTLPVCMAICMRIISAECSCLTHCLKDFQMPRFSSMYEESNLAALFLLPYIEWCMLGPHCMQCLGLH